MKNIFLKKLKKLFSLQHWWFYAKPEINKATARTLTATTVKMVDGQDNYFSDEYIDSTLNKAKQYENFVVPENKYSKYNIRKITPLEGLLLQGFDKHFTNRLKNLKLVTHSSTSNRHHVSVNVVYAIFNYLYFKII